MKFLLFSAQLCVNQKETWISYLPYSDFIKCEDKKGFNILSLRRKRIKGNYLKDLTMDWFTEPVQIYFKKVNYVEEISKIKKGDKEIISKS